MIWILIKWTLFSISVGIAEGAFFAHGGYLTKYPYNIHTYLMVPRVIVGAALLFDAWYYFGMQWYGLPVLGLGFMGMFPIWHDGALYQTRHFLDFPLYNFFSESTTTTAQYSFDFITRVILFLLGVLCYWVSFWFIA